MEDDLKILSVEYISNDLLDHAQFFKLKLRWPSQGNMKGAQGSRNKVQTELFINNHLGQNFKY